MQQTLHDTFTPSLTSATAVPARATVPSAGFLDTLGIFAEVFLPVLSKGAIMRRPRVLAMAEYLDLDRRSVRRMQRVRERHGDVGPLMLSIPGRRIALILGPDDVHRVLGQTP